MTDQNQSPDQTAAIPRRHAIVYRRIADLKKNPRNARTHPADQIKKIAASIKQFGFLNPMIVGAEDELVAGHGRLEAAELMGLVEVPTIDATHLTPAEQRAYMLADNRIAEDSGWNTDLLRVELADLAGLDFDIGTIGFDDPEIDDLLAPRNDGSGDDDKAPPVPAVAVSKPGDLWVLGNHRLLCGDSTQAADADRLMGGELADLIFTDPPYNGDYSGRGDNELGKIQNDAMSDEDFEAFLTKVMTVANRCLRPLGCIYVCHPDSQSAPKIAFEKTFAAQFKKSSTIIWSKQSAGMGWQDYRAQHEPILYGWKEGDGKHFFCGDRKKTTIWNIGRDAQASYVHPTQKPVALPVEAIENSSTGGQNVVDLFGGSGSTLIACEKTGRRARLMELDPKYVDVIVVRWQEFTGLKAVRHDGVEFDSLAQKAAREPASV